MNEYAPTKDDLEGGGGGNAKPRGKYTGIISRTKSKKDKNGLVNLGFGLSILKGKLKKRLVFENYLVLSSKGTKFAIARRNSFYRAIGLDEGTIPPGAPGGPDASVLDGTVVDFTLEHRYENVPGEEYDIDTSSWNKSRWVTEGWEECLDDKGRLVRTPSGELILGEDGEPEPIEPRESLTFYSLSDDFDGLGSHVAELEAASSKKPSSGGQASRPAAQADESAADEEWG